MLLLYNVANAEPKDFIQPETETPPQVFQSEKPVTCTTDAYDEVKQNFLESHGEVGFMRYVSDRIAGRVDCIAEFDGKLSIIDFKTSTKERKDEYNESYYIQASAYAEMFEERTGIEINQICILVVTQDGAVQEFVKDKKEYLPLLIETISQWEERNEISINSITNMDNVATV